MHHEAITGAFALRTENCVDRAGWQAARATDAFLWINPGQLRRRFHAELWVERQRLAFQQSGKRTDQCRPARRALVNLRSAVRQRLSVGQAAVVAATRALRLRQQRIDVGGVNLPHLDRPQWHNTLPMLMEFHEPRCLAT